MNLKDLQTMKENAQKELEVAEKKQDDLKKLSEEVDEEVNARRGLIFSIDRVIALKN